MENKDQYQLFENIYKLYVKAIFRFAYFKVSEYELAENITAETFLRFWKLLSQKEEIRNNKAFLYFIARGLVIDHFRKETNREKVPLDKIDERLMMVTDNTEERIETEEQIRYIYIKLKEIRKEYQDIILLYYVDELEIKEIAYILKKKENSVRVLIHRALKALKNIL